MIVQYIVSIRALLQYIVQNLKYCVCAQYCAIIIHWVVNCKIVNSQLTGVASGSSKNEEIGFIIEGIEV
jgi:hypothetical protein